jgi:hypothetical protein
VPHDDINAIIVVVVVVDDDRLTWHAMGGAVPWHKKSAIHDARKCHRLANFDGSCHAIYIYHREREKERE